MKWDDFDKTVFDGSKPVNIVEPKPVLPQNRWQLFDKEYLFKEYEFPDHEQRSKFVARLMGYEKTHKHYAVMILKKTTVGLKLKTEGINTVTEPDKEYASYADKLYKDVLYASGSV